MTKTFHPRHLPRPRFANLSYFEFLEQRQLLSTSSPAPFLPNESALTSPRFSDLWHLQNTGQTLSSPSQGPATGTAGADISAAQAWNLTTGSNNVIIAVLDTGIDWSQPDLAANLFTNTKENATNGLDDDGNGFADDIHGWNFVTNTNNTNDTVGHGTSVAGVIGAVGNNGIGIVGVNWHVSLLPVVVGTAAGVNDNDLVAGINYVTTLRNEGFNIVAINASYLQTVPSVPTSADITAIKNAGNAGIMYVNAAGNGGADISDLNLLPGWSSLTNVITVAATNNQDQLASFSNFGSSVQLAAPGVDILTTTPGGTYSVLSGTSFAAPMVSGAVALLASENPSATMAQIKNDILSSVDKVSGLTGEVSTGGRLNVYNALETLIGARAPLGAIEQATATTVTGYAYDPNAGQVPLTVNLFVDGTFISAMTANINRPDLASLFGSTSHGFSFSLPSSLSLGSHTITVYANDFPSTSATTLLATKTVTITPTQPTVIFKGNPIANNQANSVDFSGQLVGAPPQVRTFTVINQSGNTLSLSNLTVPAGYIITDNLVTSLAPGASDTISVELSTATKGVYKGNIAFNWGAGSTFSFPVSGSIGDSFVQNLYLDLLGRPADTNGLNYWNSTLINQTMTPTQITAAFVNSTEFRTDEINNLYETILNRPADSGSIPYWLSAFKNGETEEQISAGFYGSQEYFTAHGGANSPVLNAFYVGILGRPIDSSGLNYWSSLIAGGASRTTVALDIIHTTEGEQRTVEALYLAYLHRSVDTSGLSYWTNQLAHGQTHDTVLISLASSPEYFAM